MASLKVMKNRNSLSRVRDQASPVKRLSFDFVDDVNDQEEFHPPTEGGIRKRIDFGPSDESDMDPNAEDAVPIPDDIDSPVKNAPTASTPKATVTATPAAPNAPSSKKDQRRPSPPKTRSGRIYKKRSVSPAEDDNATPKSSKRHINPQKKINFKLNLLQKDIPVGKENRPIKPKRLSYTSSEEEPLCRQNVSQPPELPSPKLTAPPPLNYIKRPVSRLSGNESRSKRSREDTPVKGALETSIHNNDDQSPPSNGLKKLKLFDGQSPSGVVTSACAPRTKSVAQENRRASAPAAPQAGCSGAGDAITNKKRKLMTNVNPFTSTPTFEGLKKRQTSSENKTPEDQQSNNNDPMATPVNNGTVSRLPASPATLPPGKRLRVSDININRYSEEFVELEEIASGAFGRVAAARHRLDGMVYAIKMSKNAIHGQTHEERVAMNEVFAHSALKKHKHVVRYYNSWAESGRIFIQNEFCEGGSLGAKIEELRAMGKKLSETELKKILLHVAKGLQYIHSKNLVHLDIKPENIFISLDSTSASSSPSSITELPMEKEEPATQEQAQASAPAAQEAAAAAPATAGASAPQPAPETSSKCGDADLDSSDSGTGSEILLNQSEIHPMDESASYKIGDLGHVVSTESKHHPEEGDCRYMAPELLLENVSRDLLFKTDVFSLGLSMYEAASLVDLPKNSLENPMYEHYKAGLLPSIEGYSNEFNLLIKSMVNPDPLLRPSVARLISWSSPRSNSHIKSRSQLYNELRDAKARLKQLQQELQRSLSSSGRGATNSSPDRPNKAIETPSGTESTSKSEGSNAEQAKPDEVGITRMNLRQRPKKESPTAQTSSKGQKQSSRKKTSSKGASK